MSGDEQSTPCPACLGQRVTEHEQHTVVTDEKGNQSTVVHRFTGPCNTCHGSGLG